MNIRFCVIVAVLVTLAASVPVAAGGDLAFYGAWFTPSDLDSSFGGGIKTDFLFGDSPFGMELRASWFPELGRNLSDFIEGENQRILEIEMIPLDIGANFHLFENRNLYFGAGLSYVMLDSNIGTLDDEFGWYLAAGLKTGKPGGGLGFFVDAMYRVIEGTVEDGEFNEFDVDVDGFGFNLGLVIRF